MRWREWGAWAFVLIVIAGVCLVLWHAPALPAERCRASWYGLESGTRTANGESYRVCLRGRCIVTRHNDRGPGHRTHRCADLSRGAARALGFERAGTALVEISKMEHQK